MIANADRLAVSSFRMPQERPRLLTPRTAAINSDHKWFEIPSLTMILTPRAELRTQRAFFNAALALLGMVEGIYDGPELSLG